MFNRESFFAIPSTGAVEPVETPAGTAYVRTITVGEKDRLELEDKGVSFRARLLVLCVCDEGGAPVFRAGDAHRIADYPLHIVEPLVEAALRVNKFSKEDVDGLEKKSTSQTGSSDIS